VAKTIGDAGRRPRRATRCAILPVNVAPSCAVSNRGLASEHGALKLVECWGDDVPEGKVTSFSMAVKCKDDETVVFSWITWPSRKMRDEGMKKVMADPRLQPDTNPMPFDGTRRVKEVS
jgi:uncharacterized protein YbaA (DUF1428 family)